MKLDELEKLALKLVDKSGVKLLQDASAVDSVLTPLGWQKKGDNWVNGDFIIEGNRLLFNDTSVQLCAVFLLVPALKRWLDVAFSRKGKMIFDNDVIYLEYEDQAFIFDDFGVETAFDTKGVMRGSFSFDSDQDIKDFFAKLKFLCGGGFNFESPAFNRAYHLEKLLVNAIKKVELDTDGIESLLKKFGWKDVKVNTYGDITAKLEDYYIRIEHVKIEGSDDKEYMVSFGKRHKHSWGMSRVYLLNNFPKVLIWGICFPYFSKGLRVYGFDIKYSISGFKISSGEAGYNWDIIVEEGTMVVERLVLNAGMQAIASYSVRLGTFGEVLRFISKEWVKNFKLNCPMEG